MTVGPASADRAAPAIPELEDAQWIGAGGFGRVWRARWRGRLVAVKVGQPASVARYAAEARALAAIGPPHAPELLHSGQLADDAPFLVMELIVGPTLDAAFPDAQPASAAMSAIAGLAAAIDAIHGRGWLHRDLKPANVLLTSEGRVVVLDFGLAIPIARASRRDRARLTTTGRQLGTPAYMAPEQLARAGCVGPEADRYALGVIAFELLTGRVPFVGSRSEITRGHALQRPPAASLLAPLPTAVDRVLGRAMAKRPEDRHGSATELATELDRALSAEAAPRPQPSARAGSRPSGDRDETRPVAMLAVSGVSSSALRRQLEAVAGVVAGRRREPLVAAFPAAPSPAEGLRDAVHCARALVRVGARCVVHTAPLRVSSRRDRLLVAGDALAPTWFVAGEAGVELTDAARRRAPELARASQAPAPDPGITATTPLRGRRELLTALANAAAAAFERAEPTLVTLVAEPGMGATRVLAALEGRLTRRGAQVVSLAGLHPERGDGAAPLAALAQALVGGSDGSSADEAAARTLLSVLGVAAVGAPGSSHAVAGEVGARLRAARARVAGGGSG